MGRGELVGDHAAFAILSGCEHALAEALIDGMHGSD